MSFVEMIPQRDLFACELAHYTTAKLPLHLARLIVSELGEPHLRNKHFAAWYAHAILHEGSFGDTMTTTIAYSIRIDTDGSVTVLVPWVHRDAWSRAIANMVPTLVAVPMVA